MAFLSLRNKVLSFLSCIRLTIQLCQVPFVCSAFIAAQQGEPLYFAAVVYIFFLKFFFTCSERSQIRYLPYLHTWCGLIANLECMSEICWMRLAENAICKNWAKDRHQHTISQIRHVSTHTHTQLFYGPFQGPPGWAGARRELLDFMVQGKIYRGRHTDHPAGRHSIQTKQCPPPPSPHFLQARCPFCRPTNSVKALKAYIDNQRKTC